MTKEPVLSIHAMRCLCAAYALANEQLHTKWDCRALVRNGVTLMSCGQQYLTACESCS